MNDQERDFCAETKAVVAISVFLFKTKYRSLSDNTLKTTRLSTD